MDKKKRENEALLCPVGKFFSNLESACGKKSEFLNHMTKSRIEFLKAIRALVDETIDGLETKASRKGKRKVSKIKVQ